EAGTRGSRSCGRPPECRGGAPCPSMNVLSSSSGTFLLGNPQADFALSVGERPNPRRTRRFHVRRSGDAAFRGSSALALIVRRREKPLAREFPSARTGARTRGGGNLIPPWTYGGEAWRIARKSWSRS